MCLQQMLYRLNDPESVINLTFMRCPKLKLRISMIRWILIYPVFVVDMVLTRLVTQILCYRPPLTHFLRIHIQLSQPLPEPMYR